MTFAGGDERPRIRVVLADANVLYSRVLGDYLLYAATQGVLEIRWSAAILVEVVEHLAENIAEFDAAAGARLVAAMNGAFPAAEIEPDGDAEAVVAELLLPDEDDRHVLAAAVAVDADVLCTPRRNRRLHPCCTPPRWGSEHGHSDAGASWRLIWYFVMS